jgi:hypothetical protein
LTVADAVVVPPAPIAVNVYVVERLGKTRRLPVFCTVPMVWSMLTLETSPVTCQRKVDDWPIRIDVGSAENCATTGAAVAAPVPPVPPVGVVPEGVVLATGGGGGGTGACFFPHPTAKLVSKTARQMAGILNLSNMKMAS